MENKHIKPQRGAIPAPVMQPETVTSPPKCRVRTTKGAKTMYFIFRKDRHNYGPHESDGTQALEEYYNSGEWTLAEIESELNRLNIKDISVYQIEE
jgi:hypothetical protein